MDLTHCSSAIATYALHIAGEWTPIKRVVKNHTGIDSSGSRFYSSTVTLHDGTTVSVTVPGAVTEKAPQDQLKTKVAEYLGLGPDRIGVCPC